jgi:hypothetical protein
VHHPAEAYAHHGPCHWLGSSGEADDRGVGAVASTHVVSGSLAIVVEVAQTGTEYAF